MSIKSCLVVLVCFMTMNLIGQKDGDPISLGTYKIIDSKILYEQRTLLVHLPPTYQKGKTEHYPVIYMLYGNHTSTYFAETVSALDNLGEDGHIPQMILIGISNTDRYRDLLPGEPKNGDSGIDGFGRFLSEEVFPWVEKSYRTSPFRLIVGPQAGANFVFYTLFKSPQLFNSAIIENPFRWVRGRDKSISQAQTFLKSSKAFPISLYISCNDNDELEVKGVEYMKAFEAFVEKNRPEEFRMSVEYFDNWDEFLAPFPVRQGLKTIFKDYQFPKNKDINSLDDIVAHYEALSQNYGYRVKIPEQTLTGIYDSLLTSKPKIALTILDYIMQVYPNSVNGLWRRSVLLMNEGKLDEAVSCLERMIPLMDGDVGMIKSRIKQLLEHKKKGE